MSIGSPHKPIPKTTSWLTPPYILEALGGADAFDLDPCAADNQPWATAKRHYTKADNGLISRWDGRVWLNPPYTRGVIAKWLARLADHGRGTALIFARTENAAFSRQVFDAAHALLFIEGRLHFHVASLTRVPRGDGGDLILKPGERYPHNSGGPSVLCSYGADDTEILAAADLPGAFVPLRLAGLIRIGSLGPAADALGTWAEEIRAVMSGFDAPVTLSTLYRAFAGHRKASSNPHYREQIRKQLQRGPYRRAGRGLWENAS